MNVTRTFILAIAVLLGTGCESMLTDMIIKAPNQGITMQTTSDPSPLALDLVGVDQQFRIDVGPPAASLSVWVVEPFNISVEQTSASESPSPSTGEDRGGGGTASRSSSPRGTVLVIHGVRNERFWMLGVAKKIAAAGYRAVLVDLRGHGRSSGDYLTYGVVEKVDMSQVIDELERRELIAGRLGVYGISYGAAVAIQLAGYDPRIEAVVSVAAFSSMRDEVPHYARTLLPPIGHSFSDEELQQIINTAAKKADFDPDLASPEAWITRTDAPTLIVHGTEDWIIPPAHAYRLHDRANPPSRLLLVPRIGHITIWFDPGDHVATEAIEWFDRWLVDEPVTPDHSTHKLFKKLK